MKSMEDIINRKEYLNKCCSDAKNVIFNEKLPMPSEIISFAVDNKSSDSLQHVFDFFGDEEEIKKLTGRKNINFSEEESRDFIDSVIAANILDISISGVTYKKLMACGDTIRIRGTDCHSEGREIALPIDELTFNYEVKNSYYTFEKSNSDYHVAITYDEFVADTDGKTNIYVRTPKTCKHATKRGVCPICAGQIPEGVQNIGAFATLMITEFATQNALSSMNKGRKVNVNLLLTKDANNIKTLEEYHEWMEEILQDLKGESVERRYYEIALLGRLHFDKNKKGEKKLRVSSLSSPKTTNYLGEFIYRPNETNFKNMIQAGEFQDESLKAQIALNSYKRNNV